MNKAVSVAVMRESDAWTIANKVPSKELMRRAGEGIFRSAQWTAPVAIVCGSGNNAGDGYVVADLLHREGIAVTIVLMSGKFSEDGKYYYDICMEHGIPAVRFSAAKSEASGSGTLGTDSGKPASAGANAGNFSPAGAKPASPDSEAGISDFSRFATILDCILGTGFEGEPRDPAKAAINAINASGAYVISADINSGLNGDSGLGTTYVKSDLTVSIGDFKLGHFRGLADTAMKEKVNVDIGIEIQGDYILL